MDLNVLINDGNVAQNLNSDVISVVVKEKASDQNVENTKRTDFISSRLDFIKQSFNEEESRKSLVLFSKQGPLYRHYPHKESKISRVDLCSKFKLLPEIRGQNLFETEKERSYEIDKENNLKVEESKMDTLRKLQSSILRYGSKGENIWMGFPSSKYHPMMVRPGFSARRYLANLARNLNETLVKKLMYEGHILENNLYTTNCVMPHIRRRLSDDLSRYPEPYRILKQMLMAPGPLNEFSFVWSRKKKLQQDVLLMYNEEMEQGDIKILSKKSKNEYEEEFEEVKYSELSGHKKKTILSNLLMKSAMNHALRVKEEMMEYNDNLLSNKTKSKIHNIHIPVMKFDMKVAIADLLTKETLQTLTTTDMDLQFSVNPINDRFKGRGLKAAKHNELHSLDSERKETERSQTSGFDYGTSNVIHEENEEEEINRIYERKISCNEKGINNHFKGRAIKKPKSHSSTRLNIENEEKCHQNTVCELTEPILEVNEDQEDKLYPQNLTLRLNQVHPKKLNKKKIIKSDSIPGNESVNSDSNLPQIRLDALNETMQFCHSKNFETQGIAFAEMIKKKSQMATSLKDNIRPYGKYRDPTLAGLGDIDPTTSFVNWKYKENHSCANDAESTVTDIQRMGLTNALQKEQSQSRLIQLLRGQADSVAEAVLSRTEGGIDFASDVNVAIRDILGGTQPPVEQVWNLEVNDMKKEVEYKGVITNLFKSIFKDELETLGGGELDLSPSLMKLLQSGYNLKLEDLEMIVDPVTGKMIASLKKEVQIPKKNIDSPPLEMLDNKHFIYASSAELSFSDSHSIIASSISQFDFSPTPMLTSPDIKKVLEINSNVKRATPKISTIFGEDSGRLTTVSERTERENVNKKDIQENSEKDEKYIDEEVRLSETALTSNFVELLINPVTSLISETHYTNDVTIKNHSLVFERKDGLQNQDVLYPKENGDAIDQKSIESDQNTVLLQGNQNGNDTFGSSNKYSNVLEKENPYQKDTAKSNKEVKSTLEKKQSSKEKSFGKRKEHKMNEKYAILNDTNIAESTEVKMDNVGRSKRTHSILQKIPGQTNKTIEKEKKSVYKEKNNQKKKNFIFGNTDETKDVIKLYNKSEQNILEDVKSKKSFEKKITKKQNVNEEIEKEYSGDIRIKSENTSNSSLSGPNVTLNLVTEEVDTFDDVLSDEEIKSNDGKESRRLKMLLRQERVAHKRAEVQRLRKEEEMKRKKVEEERKLEAQRIAFEESIKNKLEEERKRKEEEFLLQKEREKEQEQALLDSEKRKEYFHLRQIEKERQQREEFNRRIEEARIRQAIAERLKREEQEMQEREEAAMLAKLNEEERNEYLKRKAELLEKQRLEEEEERKLKEERARLALEEAKAIAKQQSLERARLEEIQKMKIEDEGLKRYLNVTPAFVWSYFEFLNILAVNENPSVINLQSSKRS